MGELLRLSKLNLLKPGLIVFLLGCGVFAQTTDPKTVQDQELKRAEERAKEVRQQQPKTPDIRVQKDSRKTAETMPLDEKVCFRITEIVLDGEDSKHFIFALQYALKTTKLRVNQPDKANAPCLGANGINVFMTIMQNMIIDRGYVTTRVLAEPQDLKTGKLILTLIPGRIRKIKFEEAESKRRLWRPSIFTALPFQSGKILNLRDIEQGLENLKRVPTVEADIKIIPADKPNESDLLVVYEQKKVPIRGNISFDDAGSQGTGKYQGNVTVSFDNPLSLNDLFYVSVGRDLLGYDKVNLDQIDNETGLNHGGSNNWSIFYSVPFGKWQLTVDASHYNYNQLVAGANQAYSYSGVSNAQNITLSRLMYRDKSKKVFAFAKGWTKSSKNFIDDTEIEVQRRRTAGYELGLAYKHFLGQKTLDGGLTFKKGTGANGALPAPEEIFGEGTSRMKVWTANLNFNVSFTFKNKQITFNTLAFGQLNRTPLIPQDKLGIGDRRTVRGFDGEFRLLADRGFFVQNEIGMKVKEKHQVYFGFDGGNLSGPSTRYLVGKTLVGSVLGIRGQKKLFKNFSYDVFVGTPIIKPTGFRTAAVTFGFNLNYTF